MLMVITLVLIILEVIFGLVRADNVWWSLIILVETHRQSHRHLLSTQSTSWLAWGKASIVCWIRRLRTLNEYHLPTTTTTYHLPTIWNTSQYYSTLNEYHCCPPSTYYVEYFITLLCHIPVYHILAYFYLPPYFCPRQELHHTLSITNTVIQIRKIIMVLIKGTFWFWAHCEFRGSKVYQIFLQSR